MLKWFSTYQKLLRSTKNVCGARIRAIFSFSTYHDFSRCIVNIFRLEIGASFFFNTTYHDFLRCIANICRLQIRASLFSFNTTYHDILRCIVNIYGFQIRATGSYHSPHFATNPSPPTFTTFPPFPPTPTPHTRPSHPTCPSLATEISLSPMTFSSPPSWPPFAVRILRSLPGIVQNKNRTKVTK